jgi:hypothetical protein
MNFTPRCPVCGEQLPWFDRKHVSEKHPKYFHENRRWQLTGSFFACLCGVFLIISIFSASSVQAYGLVVALVALAFNFFVMRKQASLRARAHEYNVGYNVP